MFEITFIKITVKELAEWSFKILSTIFNFSPDAINGLLSNNLNSLFFLIYSCNNNKSDNTTSTHLDSKLKS